MTRSSLRFCIFAAAAFLMYAGSAVAQGHADAVKVTVQVNVILGTGVKGTEHVTAQPASDGMIPQGILSSLKPHTEYVVYQCPDGTYILPTTADNPCPNRKRLGAFIWFPGAHVILVIDPNAPEGQGLTFQGGGVMTGGGGREGPMGVPVWVQLDIKPGYANVGGLNLCEEGDACSQGHNAFMFITEGTIQFGDRWISAGPLFSFEYRRPVTGTFTESGSEGGTSYTYTESLRTNSVNIGGRIILHLGHSPWRIFFDAGEDLNSITYKEVCLTTCGDYVDTYSYHYDSPFGGAGLQYWISDHFGFIVEYHYSQINPERYFSGGTLSYSEMDHMNDLGFGFTIPFGARKR